MKQIKVGRIRYLNTLPFYHGLESWPDSESGIQLQWEKGTPAEINQKIHAGKIDLAPISSLEYLNHQDDYLLLPHLCIGSQDFSGSVLFFSRERIQGLDRATVSLTQDSLSAAALLRILLKLKFRFNNEFLVEPTHPQEMLAKSKGCLLIGDEALFFQPKEFLYKTDLSQLWWEWTSLPFCFSVWAVRKKFYREQPEAVKTFCRRLKSNTEKNLQDIEKLLREGLDMTIVDEKFPTAFGYLFNLNYSFDADMQKGLLHFFDLACELGISPPARKLEFIGTAPSTSATPRGGSASGGNPLRKSYGPL